MKKKIGKITDLKVQSFVTSLNQASSETVKGGGLTDFCVAFSVPTCPDCFIRSADCTNIEVDCGPVPTLELNCEP